METPEKYEQLRHKLEMQQEKRDELVEIRNAITEVIESEEERIEETSQQLFIHSELASPDKIREMEVQNAKGVLRELEEQVGEHVPVELLESALLLNGFQESDIERLRSKGEIYQPEEGAFTST